VGFEEVRGSAFNDALTGSTNLYKERFEGGAGDDTIDGGAITDTLNLDNINIASYTSASGAVTVNLGTGTSSGAAGNDVLRNINMVFGSASADVLTGSNRTDVAEFFEGGAGNDTLDGQGGTFDIALFSTASSGVTANLATGIATGTGTGTDTLLNIEGVFGSKFADVLMGGSNSSVGGNELFRGQGGNDTIDGGTGFDWAFYDTGTTSVVVTLGNGVDGSASDGQGGTDVLRSIEGVRGSAFNDTLTGSDRTDSGEVLEGREGADVIDGKGGVDTAWYKNSRAGVTVDLSQGKALNDGYGSIDTLTNIENVYGSRDFNDSITGNSGNNLLEGNGGNDTLVGGLGNDSLLGGLGSDVLTGGLGADWFVLESTPSVSNVDVFKDFASGTDKILLDDDVFTKFLGTAAGSAIKTGNFLVGASSTKAGAVVAKDADDYLLYDTTTDKLYYDADGSGSGAAVWCATVELTGIKAPVYTDFLVVV
jgi:Ca2+-binding RTX toxin-like protein